MVASILESFMEPQMLTSVCLEAGVAGERGGVKHYRANLYLTHWFCERVQAEYES